MLSWVGSRSSAAARKLDDLGPGPALGQGCQHLAGMRAEKCLRIRLAGGGQPQLEVGRFGQGQPVEERAAVQRQQPGRIVNRSLGQLPDVCRHGLAQAQPVALGADRVVSEFLADRPERVTEVLARGFLRALAPQQAENPLPRFGAGSRREVTEKRQRFGRQVNDLFIALGVRAAEQAQVDWHAGHYSLSCEQLRHERDFVVVDRVRHVRVEAHRDLRAKTAEDVRGLRAPVPSAMWKSTSLQPRKTGVPSMLPG